MELELTKKIDRSNLYENMGNIIKYLRVSKNLNQTDIANILNCSRSKASRIENGLSHPDVHEWHLLASHFGLSTNSYLHKNIKIVADDDINAFKISSPYSEDLFSGGKILNMHIEVFKKLLGKRAFSDFCSSEKIDPLYFVNINNPLNANFNFRIMQNLIIKGVISNAQQLRDYSKCAVDVINSSPFKNAFDQATGIDRIFAFFEHSDLYESNHTYKIFDYVPGKQLICGFKPNEHVDRHLYHGPFLKGVICQFLHFCFLEIGECNVISEKITCINRNDSYCTYKYISNASDVG